MKKYSTEEEIADLVRSFEEATVSRDEWRHAEHLVVALYYLSHHDREIAYAKMRSGIHNLLLKGFGVDLTEEMPYHETITVFWMRTVASFLAGSNGSSLPDKVAEMVGRFDKDYPLRFYSRELLFSDEARSSFVEPDIQLFD